MNISCNLSSNHKHQDESLFTTPEIVTGSTILGFLMRLALFGNLLTLYILFQKPRLRTPTDISIFFLSISDVLMAVFVMPFSLASVIKGTWAFSKAACTLNAYLINVLLGVSLITMACTAVTRYIRVMRPSLHKYMTQKTAFVNLSTTWLVTLILTAVPIIVDSGHGSYYAKRCFCRLHYQTETVYWKIDIFRVALAVIFVSTIFVSYYKVFRHVSHHNRTVGSNLQQGGHLQVEEVKLTRTLLLVVFGFATCWIPTGIIEALDILGHRLDFEVPAFVILQRIVFQFASSAVNPLIYGFTNKRFKKQFLGLLCKPRQSRCRQILPA